MTPPAPMASGTPDELPGSSLEAALDLARREVTALDAREAALPLNEGVTHFAWNPGQDFTARFLSAGSVLLEAGDQEGAWQVCFRYSGAGDSSTVRVEGTRAEFLHADGVREWFDNGSAGIEHGFTLDQRPQQGARLEIALDGMRVILENPDDYHALLLQDAHGSPRLRYAGLKAWDADGKDLLAAMEPSATGLAITVDDRGARYPVTIDPLITVLRQELDPPITGSGSGQDFFGCSVAFDGDTALIGAPYDENADGRRLSGNAYLFTRNGEGANESWALQGRLGNGGAADKDCYGAAVALQGDIAVIGVPNDGSSLNGFPGSVRVWARSNGQWTQQAWIEQTLSIPWQSSKCTLGWHLALSGETLVLGIPEANLVEVYTRSGTQWSKQQRIPSPWIGATNFGSAVAVEGETLAVGAEGTSTSEGCVYYYTRSNGAWSGVKLPTPADIATGDYYGSEVAISGNTILATAPGRGCVYAFQKTGQNWDAGTKLTSTVLGENVSDFGNALAIEGDHALIGAADVSLFPPFLSDSGKVFAARRIGGVWQLTGSLVDPGRQGLHKFGCALAIRGTRALVGDMSRTTAGGRMTGDATFYHLENDIWSPGTTVDPGDDAGGSRYGRAVAVDGDTLAIGAGAESNADGLLHEAVHVFKRTGTGWTHQARLGDPAPATRGVVTGFGSALAISGDTVVVGSPTRSNSDNPFDQDGSVHIFERSGEQWNLITELAGTGQFGISLAAEGNTVAIGAPYFPLPGEALRQGKVFIYTRDATAWTQTAELLAPTDADYNNFGRSVALDGGTLLAGAPYGLEDQWAHIPYGAVVVFRRSGIIWRQETVLTNHPFDKGFFGFSVDLGGDHAVVSVPDYNETCCLFLRRSGSTWVSGDLHYLDGLRSLTGNQVALDGNAAVISADNNTVAPSVCKLLEFVAGHWLPSRDLGTTGTTVAMDGNTLVVGDWLAQRPNPSVPEVTARTGHAWIFDLSGAEKYLLQTFDQDQDLMLSRDEWLAIYGNPAPATAAGVHAFIDADDNGLVTESELVNAAEITARAKDKTASAAVAFVARVRAFVELDGSASGGERDGVVNRAEIALMWKPGTPPKPIDSFWRRANVQAGYDLRAWLVVKTLPSLTTYARARQTRSNRRSLGLRYDRNYDGLVQYFEFSDMLERETGSAKKSGSLWSALTNPSRRSPVNEISIDGFVDAAKFPGVLVGK